MAKKQPVGFIQDIVALVASIIELIKALRELGIFGANINAVKTMGAQAKRSGKRGRLLQVKKALEAKLKAAKAKQVSK